MGEAEILPTPGSPSSTSEYVALTFSKSLELLPQRMLLLVVTDPSPG